MRVEELQVDWSWAGHQGLAIDQSGCSVDSTSQFTFLHSTSVGVFMMQVVHIMQGPSMSPEEVRGHEVQLQCNSQGSH